MTDDPKKDPAKRNENRKGHILMWSLVTLFIILAIAGMWAIDYYFSPEMIREESLPEAVGK